MQKDLSNELVRLKKLYELSMTISGDPVEVFRHIAKIILISKILQLAEANVLGEAR